MIVLNSEYFIQPRDLLLFMCIDSNYMFEERVGKIEREMDFLINTQLFCSILLRVINYVFGTKKS